MDERLCIGCGICRNKCPIRPIRAITIDPALNYAERLGENGREHIRNDYLLTRHLGEYMLVFLSLYHAGDIVYL